MFVLSRFSTSVILASLGLATTLAATSAQAQQCPDWQLNGIPITTDAETAWAPQQYPMFAGGGLDLSACGSVPGLGHITAAPNFSITYDDRGMDRDLEFRVESQCDTTLLINTNSGEWEFNDDNEGLNAGMRLPAATSGRYDVWVGTYGSQPCQATLIAETFEGGGAGAGAGSGGMCPDWSLGGEGFRLTAGGRETVTVAAGGNVDMFSDNCAGIDAHGYVSAAPSASFYFDPSAGPAPLEISVNSTCDTLLLVNDPTTNWSFNDDSEGLMPGLSYGQASEGRYDVWVGTFGRNGCDATLSVSAGGSQAPSGGK